MSTPRHRLLSWDSDFLGFAVARIAPQIEDEKSVTRVLDELKAAGVRLAYWQPRDRAPLRNFARSAGARFIGTHVRYERSTSQGDVRLERCKASTPELELLAVAAGTLSRYALDPAMPAGTAARLYTVWMRESFGGAMGDEVLAARDALGVAGMVTLKYGADEGVIGLLAVAERCRGAGVGRLLVDSATARFAALGMGRVSVVTQGENAGACRLYESAGYTLAEASLIAHFWL
jgi:dTDP-4-amino-4,6-dideoxy-D-galactose acyltransferase